MMERLDPVTERGLLRLHDDAGRLSRRLGPRVGRLLQIEATAARLVHLIRDQRYAAGYRQALIAEALDELEAALLEYR